MAGLQAPLVKVAHSTEEAVAAGADNVVELRAPIDGTVTGATYAPEVLITGADTNSRTLQVVNKGQDGTGVAVVAVLPLTAGVNSAAYDEKSLNLSGTPANLAVVAGDILALQSTHVGTGIADPGGLWTLTFAR